MKATLFDDPLVGLNPTNRDRIYQELREHQPVYRSSLHAAWVLTRYADVNHVLRHPEACALEVLPALEALARRASLQIPHLLEFCASLSLLTRPPRHEAVRRVLAQALGGIRRLNLAELLNARAEKILADAERCGAIDLAEEYGRALALYVIGTFLGLPESDLPRLRVLARDFMAVFERTVPSVRGVVELDRCAGDLTHYFEPLLLERRRNPGTDGLSLILALAAEQFAPSDRELAQNCLFFFIAAEETTTAAISSGALVLLQRPALRAQLAADPSQVPLAVQELLRLSSPIQYVARQLRVDLEVEDQVIPAGEPIMLMLGSANRDPAAFPDPDEPVLARQGPKALVFAAGPYTCVGAQLATFEVEVAVRRLLARPRLQLAPSPPVWSQRMNVAPLEHLEARFA
jgi:cytochrome P450